MSGLLHAVCAMRLLKRGLIIKQHGWVACVCFDLFDKFTTLLCIFLYENILKSENMLLTLLKLWFFPSQILYIRIA